MNTLSGIAGLPDYSDPERKQLILQGRLKDVATACGVYDYLYEADLPASRQRALVQAMIDGAAPYDPGVEAKKGTSGRTNVNWNLAQQLLKEAEVPYNDLFEGIDWFAPALPTDHGSEEARIEWEEIMAEEHSRVLKKWPKLEPLRQIAIHYMVKEGLAFAMFEDDMSWHWDVYGQQDIKFPRRSRASIEELDVIGCKRKVLPSQLMRFIESASAGENGWNGTEVQKAVIECASQGDLGDNWEEVQRAARNNDLAMSATSITVELVFLWVRELNDTCSMYVCRADGQGDFLYKQVGTRAPLSRRLVDYKFRCGTNGDFHSIRGLGAEIYSPSAALNQLLCKQVDMVAWSTTPIIKAPSEDALLDGAFQQRGPLAFLGQGFEIADTKAPDFATQLLPAINMFQGIFSTRAGTYTASLPSMMDRTERTKYEKQMQFEMQGKLSTSGINLFFNAWERHYKEVVRRMIRKDYARAEPGGDLVHEWRNRCIRRGVPLEALESIDVDRIEINTGIGKGSAIERKAALDAIYERSYARLDPLAQNMVDRLSVSSYVGTRLGKQLVPDQPGLRKPMDVQIANLENGQMRQGIPAILDPGQHHEIHAEQHLILLDEYNTALMEGMDEAQAIPVMQLAIAHTQEHFLLIPITSIKRPEIKRLLQNYSEVVLNGAKHLAKLERQQMEQGADEGEGEAGPSENMLVQAAQAQALYAAEEQKQAQKLRHKEQEHLQKMAIRDAEAARNILS